MARESAANSDLVSRRKIILTTGAAGAAALAGCSSGDGDAPLTESDIRTTVGCLLKEVEDAERLDDETMSALLAAAEDAST